MSLSRVSPGSETWWGEALEEPIGFAAFWMSDTQGAEMPNSAPSRGMLRAPSTWLPRPGTGSDFAS
jgi:hypothetical protein